MTQLTFFHQKRVDGGTRTGIDVDGLTCWHRFTEGSDDEDSALLWFVDIRCEGSDLPTERKKVRRWFGERPQATRIKNALGQLAKDFRVGFDNEVWPAEICIPADEEEPELKVVFSAIRRVDARDMANVFLKLSDDWETLIGDLKHPPVAI